MHTKECLKLPLLLAAVLAALAGTACSSDDETAAAPDPTADLYPHLGKQWTRVAMPGSFANRTSLAAAACNGRLYVVGGFFAPSMDDCWSTANGTNWSHDTLDAFPGINSLRAMAMTAHAGTLWLTGGVDNYGQINDQARSSAAGAAWDTRTIAEARYMHGLLSFSGKLWNIAGWQRVAGLDMTTNSVWCSADGTNWAAAQNNPGFAPRNNPGVAVHAGRMWVVGGQLHAWNSDNCTNDVWSSTDGVTWKLVTASAPFSPRTQVGLVAAGNRLYVVGGVLREAGNRYGTNDVWKSYDGSNWEPVAAGVPFPRRQENAVAAFDGGLYVIAGNDDVHGTTNDVWYSR